MLTNLLDLFQRGGYVMYPILLCSIFSIAIAVERLLYYRSCSTQDGFLQGLKDLLGHGRYEEALSLSTQTKGDCADIAAFYLKDPGKKMDEVETRAGMMMDAYDENLIFLNVIVTISPLLGLLGTIVGIINAFKVFDLRASQPFAITAGIGEALIATAFGLIVAILALVLYAIMKYVSNHLTKNIVSCCALLEAANPGR
ncbi:MAG: Biopolymer transport protein ExbB [Succiniclasticum sp.]|jgi:biopolymer transport protein ExbB